MIRTAALAAAFGAVTLAAAPALAQTSERIPTISLTGSGATQVEPDIAYLSAGVVAQAGSAAEALRENSTAMQRVFDALRSAGVAERDMQTSSLTVNPVFAPQTQESADGPRIIAYRAANQVNVTVRDLNRVGPAIDALVGAGANNINNISFDREDTTEATGIARRTAIQDALATARLYADAGGFRLGRILQVTEYGGARPVMARAAAPAAMSFDAATPTAAGEMTVEMQVNVEIEIIQ